MRFKKTTPLVAVISIVLVCSFSFGATAAGAYTGSFSTNLTSNTANQSELQNLPASTMAESNLTLVEKQYILAELNAQDISGVIVETPADDVSIIRGGDTLKFEYYTSGQNEYTL